MNMKLLRATVIVSIVALLGGCAVVPYDARPYAARPYGYYYDPAPVYYPPPVYFGPSFGITIEGGRHRRYWRH